MNTMKFIVIPGVALVTGCAGVQEVKIDQSTFYGAGKHLVTTAHRKDQSFSFYTKSDQVTAATAAAMGAIPVFGVLGAAIAGGAVGAVGQAVKNSHIGFSIDEYSKSNHIDDPKNEIGKSIAANVAKRYQLSYVGNAKTVIEKNATAEDVAVGNLGIPYALDVSTTRWVLIEGDTDLFAMQYSARMLLVETGSNKILAQGLCNYNSPKNVIELSKLQANDVSQLKSEMDLAVSSCVKNFSEKYLGIGEQNTASAPQMTAPLAASVGAAPATTPAVAPSTSASSKSAAVDSTTPAPSYPRALRGQEIVAHFATYGEMSANSSTRPFKLRVSGSTATRDCPSCNVVSDSARVAFKPAEDRICMTWSRVTYPTSGCFQVMQTGESSFELREANGRVVVAYAVRSGNQ